MIIGFFRVCYLFGPILALAIILLPRNKTLAWSLWCFSAIMIALHWVSFLSAQEDNATEVGTFGVAVWTPLLMTTLVAKRFEDKWQGMGPDPAITKILVAGLCLLPSILAFILTRLT